ncbi:MAG: hypothetical protein KDD02_02015 [Phaeodactylibacter sp.]|nr:hypothetical protein [Phaeodactylibacter sp.]MCB9302267.1 hypothetical protein [Lewinellaceae bacterium]HQU60005.1 hypothetical protein [Saprospiraceae bacterium]
MRNIFLEHIERGDFSGFRGADIPMDIPVAQSLINQQLREWQNDTVQQLELNLQNDNIVYLNLSAKVPVAGLIRRQIRAKMKGGIDLAGNSLLSFQFLDGLNLLDKQLINFFSKKIAEVLPDGIHLSKEGCTVDLRLMMAVMGYGQLLPAVHQLQLSTETGILRVKMHLKL